MSHQRAIATAEEEYAKYRAQVDVEASKIEKAYLETVKRLQRDVEDNDK